MESCAPSPPPPPPTKNSWLYLPRLVDSLKKHPYINWNLANAIVEYRNQHGPYHTIEKIKSIHLVNDEIYLKIAPYLTTR